MIDNKNNTPDDANHLPPNDEWDTLSHFAGETNKNSKTGAVRTYSEFDIYPRKKGETNEEYGARLKKMHEETAKYQAEYDKKAKEEAYWNSEQGKEEASITADFDRLSEKLDQAVQEGRMSAEHAERLKERQLERSVEEIAGVQQDYEDRQSVGDPEEEARYREWLQSKDEENTANLKKRGQEFVSVDDDYNVVEQGDKVLEDDPKDNETLGLPGPVLGETPLLPGPVAGEVEIGDIEIEGIEIEFEEDREERIKDLEDKLNKLLPDVAELYARNRRLIVGAENRANYVKVRGEYGELLDEYLRLKAKGTFEAGQREIAESIEARVEELRGQIENSLVEFAGGDLKHTEKTQEEIDAEKQRLIEEAERSLREEYGIRCEALKEHINCAFLEDFLEQQKKLEAATIDKLDNGTICRKIVNKVINNKVLKGVLIGAAIAGLAVTGVGLVAGLAAGTMTIGLSFTAGGIASGALKGGLGGLIMSRQNSEKSAVRGFTNEERIKSQLEEIDVTDKDSDTANVTEWLMEQYGDANKKDRQSNIKTTAIAAGIGAALGAFASGIKINNVSTVKKLDVEQTGTTPVEYDVDAAIDRIDVPRGHGIDTMARQMGVSEENIEAARNLMYEIEGNYGMSPGSNGVVPGFNGTVGHYAEAYPGRVSQWVYEDARACVQEWVELCAREGLLPAIRSGGEPIYSFVTNVVTEYVPNAFMNLLARATATIGAGAIGRAVAGTTTVNEAAPTTEDEPDAEAEPVAETESTTEAEPADNETASEAGANTEIENTVERSDAEIGDLINELKDALVGTIGETGVNIMTDSGETDQEAIADWWVGLSDEAKDSVRGVQRRLGSNDNTKPYGRSLRTWLELNGEM